MASDAVRAPTSAHDAGGGRRPSLPHAPALDGLRAVAVAAVLLYHAGVSWMPGGFMGVDVFFVLSGYLITSLLLAELRRGGGIDLPRFWLRRARRLLPAVVTVVLAALVLSLFLPGAEAGGVRGDALTSLFYVNNWHQIFGHESYFVAAGRPSPLRHLWSLSIEEQFYLLWPILLGAGLSLAGRARTASATIAAAGASALLMGLLYHAGHDPSRVYYGTDTRLTPLLLGATLAFVWPLRDRATGLGRHAAQVLDGAAIVGFGLLIAAFVGVQDYDSWIYRGGLALVAVTSGVVIAAIVHPVTRAARLLGTPPMRWIGDRSYGIYLWHWPVMVMTRPKLDVDLPLTALVPLQIAGTVALAALSYRYVEQPFRRGVAQERIRAWLRARRPAVRPVWLAASGTVTAGLMVWMLLPAPAGPHRATRTPAATAPLGSPAHPSTKPAAHAGPPLFVGASVMLGAADALHKAFGHKTIVDAAVGRYPSDIATRLGEYRQFGQLPARVVVQMGENGPIEPGDMQRVREALAGVRRVVLVTVHVPRSWEADVDATLAAAVRNWPQARLADWNTAVKADDLYSDGIHIRPQGEADYVRVIERALRSK
jgi:peptidoglycan/LPS O-acetylase OafA/YrhL